MYGLRRHVVIAVSGLVAAGFLIGPSAHASSGSTIVSTSGVPRGLTLDVSRCDGKVGEVNGSLAHAAGPGKPPLGKGSVSFVTDGEVELGHHYGSVAAGDLTALGTSTYVDGPSDAGIEVSLNLSGSQYDAVAENFVPGKMWKTTDWLTAQVQSYHYDASSQTVTDENDNPTWSAFLTDHPGSVINAISVFDFDCNFNGSFIRTHVNLDALKIGFNGATTTYDFEPSTVHPVISMSAPTRSAKGLPERVTGSITVKHKGVDGAHVDLLARTGKGSWTLVATVVAKQGKLSSTQHPTVATSYRWSFPGDSIRGPAESAVAKTSIGSTISIKALKKSVPAGHKVTVYGYVSPPVGARKITVYATRKGHHSTLGVTLSHDKGAWSFSHKIGSGTYAITAKVAAMRGDPAGRSTAVKVHGT